VHINIYIYAHAGQHRLCAQSVPNVGQGRKDSHVPKTGQDTGLFLFVYMSLFVCVSFNMYLNVRQGRQDSHVAKTGQDTGLFAYA